MAGNVPKISAERRLVERLLTKLMEKLLVTDEIGRQVQTRTLLFSVLWQSLNVGRMETKMNGICGSDSNDFSDEKCE